MFSPLTPAQYQQYAKGQWHDTTAVLLGACDGDGNGDDGGGDGDGDGSGAGDSGGVCVDDDTMNPHSGRWNVRLGKRDNDIENDASNEASNDANNSNGGGGDDDVRMPSIGDFKRVSSRIFRLADVLAGRYITSLSSVSFFKFVYAIKLLPLF
jgi:hypothetical protein